MEAQARSANAAAVLRRRQLVAAAAVATLVAGLVLATRAPPPLLLLLLPLAHRGRTAPPHPGTTISRETLMAQRPGEFTAVVQQLEAVPDELATTSSPERVAVLREVAADLAEQGRQLLEGSAGEPPP